jgi:sialate O-acetylesterase
MKLKRLFLTGLALMLFFAVNAQVKPALLFTDHMVIQRDIEVPVWGTAAKKEKIIFNFNGTEIKTKADKAGKWMIKLPPMPAGGPHKLTIKGKSNTIEITDILVGEVWVCSGQSNMEWIVKNTNNAEEVIANANDTQIRHFKVPHEIANLPQEKIPGGSWEVSSPETTGDFTAVGYFFAKQLREKLDIPIGLLNTSWGGTNIETWISSEAISTIPEFTQIASDLKTMDLNATYKEQIAEMEKSFGKLPQKDVGMQDGKALWAAKNYDDSDWKTIDVPGLWEQKGLPGLDGVVWFRKTIELSQEEADRITQMYLESIDDADITWINGEKIGETKSYNEKRIYDIRKGLLKPGENTMTIRVTDTGGGGGIYGNPELIKLLGYTVSVPLAGDWKYKIGEGRASVSKSPNSYPSLLYNAMLNPLLPYAMKGVIWYQGESNAGRAYAYRELFPLLIKDWRNRWGQGNFPFLWVQLANFKEAVAQPAGSDWAELREAQSMTLSLPNTGEAVIIDIGEAGDIHPRNKKDVGYRLSLAARKIAYGEDIEHSSPMYKSMKANGNEVRVTFEHAGNGLMIKDKYGYVNGFAVAGADQNFYWAKAKLEGNDVVLYADEVQKPVAVRYGWADNPEDLNLYSKDGLPVNPFRTDSWKGVTEGVRK